MESMRETIVGVQKGVDRRNIPRFVGFYAAGCDSESVEF